MIKMNIKDMLKEAEKDLKEEKKIFQEFYNKLYPNMGKSDKITVIGTPFSFSDPFAPFNQHDNELRFLLYANQKLLEDMLKDKE